MKYEEKMMLPNTNGLNFKIYSNKRICNENIDTLIIQLNFMRENGIFDVGVLGQRKEKNK